jgi:hypothetical protein
MRGVGILLLLSTRSMFSAFSMDKSKDSMAFDGVPRFATPDTGADGHGRHSI